jgi:glutamine cyclotransferase
MYEYKIADDGTLTTVAGAWEIPTKTQGLTVTANHFIYSTSYGRGNRSNIYVVKRGQKDLDAAALSCFRAPSMTEGITELNGTAYLVYESGSYLYASDPATLNVISRMHKATISSLTSLVP